eukprot:CAMPEP_0197078084 /NCGR_PEP_ID=MMETSP1384-20130603/212944_1 /TAXON_ID=29189 /ORGANISM="Ammonia sp." /LENGTH=341 /DNA_ID=CAMNT_0042516949 /DNA_START=57 /DNA_END=1082 /DNA_ORIENTATION=-
MALPKRPTALKANAVNLSEVRQWTETDVAEWMKNINDGLFAKYAENVLTTKINGTDLINLSDNDIKTKLGISIPNHVTTLKAAIHRLKKKSRSRRRKSPRTPSFDPSTNSSSTNTVKLKGLDDIPDLDLKKKDTASQHFKRKSARLPSRMLSTARSKSATDRRHKKAKSLFDIGGLHREKKAAKRAYTVAINDDDDEKIYDTQQLKRALTQKNVGKKKSDKNLHKDLGKKLWPNETSSIVKEGWMKKRGVRSTALKKRWCVLRENGHLYYFEKRPTGRNDLPQGMLDLEGVLGVEYVEDQDPNTFNIKTSDRDWIFSAMSATELVQWMSVLTKTVEYVNGD